MCESWEIEYESDDSCIFLHICLGSLNTVIIFVPRQVKIDDCVTFGKHETSNFITVTHLCFYKDVSFEASKNSILTVLLAAIPWKRRFGTLFGWFVVRALLDHVCKLKKIII
jgi:hypothetical protein